MEFLFHTAVDFEGVLAYYNIYKDDDGFFAEVLDNPGNVGEAKNFKLKMWEGSWMSSERMPVEVVEKIGDEIEAFNLKSQ